MKHHPSEDQGEQPELVRLEPVEGPLPAIEAGHPTLPGHPLHGQAPQPAAREARGSPQARAPAAPVQQQQVSAAPPQQQPPAPQRAGAPTEVPPPLPRGGPAQPAAVRSASDGEPALSKTLFAKLEEFSQTNPAPRQQLEVWLDAMVQAGASDLILRAGGRPSARVDGRIGFLPGRVPGPGALLEVLEGVLGPHRMAVWHEEGSADAALHLDGLGRFRLNAYKQMGEPALVVRRVAEDAPRLEDLELPFSELQRLSMRKRGMVLVTGIAGSGKSTTLAAMIQHMNENAERHIVTLEDPVELLFKEKRCVISQREIGTDLPDFQEGLRHALRQSPDVILIGEMRDAETVNAALDASETGHLVLSTMHTVNAAQTLDRILGFFRAERHPQLRMRLSDNLAAVLSQRLLPKASGRGLVPAFELMVSTPRVRELLEEGNTVEVARVIDQGGNPGLISFNQSLRRLVQGRHVELKDALGASDRPDELVLALRGITSGGGRGDPGGGLRVSP